MTRERVLIAPAAESAEERRAIVERARQRGFSRFVVLEGEAFEARPGDEVVRRGSDYLALEAPSPVRIPVVKVGDPHHLDELLRHPPAGGQLAVEWTGDRIIPLENAISVAGRGFHLWVDARQPAEVPASLGALEHGAHRVIVAIRSPAEVDELEALLEGPLPTALDWSLVPVVSVRPVGIGDRVIVDTTSILAPEEGLLVGSAAGFLLHVASEAVGSQFSRPRPFRVNAGAAHSYVLMADGSTRYLAELEPGDAVLGSCPAGSVRSLRVGRLKVERRPLVVVTVREGESSRTVFLQEAESVRLSSESGRVATTELTPGVRVHGVRLASARHMGREVEEKIQER
ncbi:MAG TPA: 3-dehydroquinate synthase II [Thermoplasmata archaeon]|nr:3-dehydroquinate synthase II [Thermoplasmata archaeon]